ncbi:MAG: integrase core domain-containing protein [Chloroflexi bacterium]|nr:integrase core domain-containing protein [Chloroflexota bacterium]
MRNIPQFFERTEPNALRQVDLVEDERTAIGIVHGVFYLDDYSRYCVGGRFFFDKTEDNVLQVGLNAVVQHGLPVEILSDNGPQFQVVDDQARASGTKTRYQSGWEALGVTVTFAAPYHPQTKGKEERFNRFVKEDFLDEVRDRVTSLEDLNERFALWQRWYNEQWQHSALNFNPPISRYRPGMKIAKETLWQTFAKEETRKVRLDGKIQVGKSFYQLPKGWERNRVRIYRFGNQLKVIGGKENRLLGEWTL